MSIETIPAQHSASCDRCGKDYDQQYEIHSDLVHDLIVEGWTIEDDVLCEQCTEIVTAPDCDAI